MTFLNAILLITGAGAALPLLIHLLNREKPKKIEIPTVKFIELAVQKSSGSRKVNHLLLLILRMLILLTMTLLIARPLINMSDEKNGPQSLVLVIDNSFYSAHRSNGGSVLNTVCNDAAEIIRKQPEGSRFAIISADSNDSEFTQIRDYALERVSSLSPAPKSAKLRPMIDSALSIKEKNSKTRIIVWSDFNRAGWQNNYQSFSDSDIEFRRLEPRRRQCPHQQSPGARRRQSPARAHQQQSQHHSELPHRR